MSGGSSGTDGDFELNIAPIVDCFTVLIAYLLVSMSFISLGMFEVGVAASGDPAQAVAQPETPPAVPLTLSLTLNSSNAISIHLTGGPTHLDQTTMIDPKSSGYDLDLLKTDLQKLRSSYPELKEVNITAEPAVKYKAIVKAIEAAKTEIPKAFLASS
ncbi:MAG: biopolymer transporter ExbD [Oligoflexia bacterium]|nr:biopolymer transporter ExbD [Oligoflexia bacterium]